MTEAIVHISGEPIDPWGYATMTDEQLIAVAYRLAETV